MTTPGGTCLLVGLLALLMSCGVRSQDHPQVIDEPVVPSRSGTATSVAQAHEALSGGVIYLIRSDRLVGVQRSGLTVNDQLGALLTGPTEFEAAAGIRSALPSSGGPADVRLDGTTAIVDVPEEFTRLDGVEQILGVAQLVYTFTDTSGKHTAVRLRHDERDLAAPTSTGQLVTRAVTRADYAPFAPT
jgi:hypothetical protein